MIKSFFQNITKQDKFVATFILKGFALYLLWFFLYDNWLLKDGFVDHFLIEHLVASTGYILELFGYITFQYADAVGIDGTHGVLIGAPCNGLELFALFTGFILIFPGKIVNKVIYIPIGILIIHLLNIGRLVGLAVIVKYYPGSLEFNHKYTFTIAIYAIIFVLWILWVKKYANK